MKLYIELKEMTFDDGIEYKIINGISDKEFPCYDVVIDIPNDDKFIKDTMQLAHKRDDRGKETDEIESRWFITKEQETWYNYPLYQLKDNEIIPFDYTRYKYFTDTERRIAIAEKIGHVYNLPSEAKLHRKTLKTILDHLEIVDEKFEKYNTKVESIIEKNPKSDK